MTRQQPTDRQGASSKKDETTILKLFQKSSMKEVNIVYFLTSFIMNEKVEVPAGLKKCKKCGCYKGITIDKHKPVKVSCVCHNQKCDRCGEKVYKFPVPSTIFDEERGILYVSIVCAWGHTCPDGVKGQLKNSFLIDPRTGKDLLN